MFALKEQFKSEEHILTVFSRELMDSYKELSEYGLFFSYDANPFSSEYTDLICKAVIICMDRKIPVRIMVNTANFIPELTARFCKCGESVGTVQRSVAFGFTITGYEDIEPEASTNVERIEAMRKLHEAGYKTFACIDPVLDFDSSFWAISETACFCDLYYIGLKKYKRYDVAALRQFMYNVMSLMECDDEEPMVPVYFTDRLLKTAGIPRKNLPKYCVTADYNIFKNE
jgi:hypothetical protein